MSGHRSAGHRADVASRTAAGCRTPAVCSSGWRALSKVTSTELYLWRSSRLVNRAADRGRLPGDHGLEGGVGRRLVDVVGLALDVAGVAVGGGVGLRVAAALLVAVLDRQGQRAEARELELGAVVEHRVVDAVVGVRAEVGVADDLAVDRGGLEVGHRVVAEPVRELVVAVVRPDHPLDVEVEVAA